MEQLVADGLVRNIGVSNFSLKQVEEILGFAKVKPCVNQVGASRILAVLRLCLMPNLPMFIWKKSARLPVCWYAPQ